MKKNSNARKWPVVVALVAMLIGPLAGVAVEISTVEAAPSADPSEEIVYIDRSGVIKVLDTQGSPLVEWYSPTAGWKDADLGDVNDDGDLEIVAIGEDASGNVKVAVFDPVVASGAVDPDKKIPPVDGIPWDTLFEMVTIGTPEIVQSANFDNGIPGDEFLYAYRDGVGTSHVVVMNAAGLGPDGKPTGRDWKVHVEFIDSEPTREWRFSRSGNVNGAGSDEAVLVDSKSSLTRFDVFDVDQGFLRIDGKNSDGDTIRKVAVGQVIKDGSEEVVEIRSTKPGSEALKVYKWDTVDAELSTDEAWAFSPQPEFVFLADLAGNGDQEVLFLRNNPDDDGARLIMRDEWGDDQNLQLDIEESLEELEGGTDNDYKIGAGGDVDGDGRDEIIIASSSRIVIFRDPHPGGSVAPGSRTEILRDTNNDTLVVGDLDSQGYIQGPVFGVDKESLEASLPTGTSKVAGTIRLTNVGSGGNIDFNVGSLPGWLQVNPAAGLTPATLTITFDATNIPVGVRQHTLEVTSSADVVNEPYSIDIVMTVEPAALKPAPESANFVYFPCTPPVTNTLEMVVDVGGTGGLNYEAVILGIPEVNAAGGRLSTSNITGGEIDETGTVVLYDRAGNPTRYSKVGAQSAVIPPSGTITWTNNVDWITQATAVTNTVPSTVTLAVDPTVLGAEFDVEQAVMVLVADTRAGSPPENVKIVPIMMMCAQDRVLAPTFLR